MEYFKKVEIKSEADLPKEDGEYIVHSKCFPSMAINNFMNYKNHNFPDYDKKVWLRNYDWYLLPISQPEITDEEIESEANYWYIGITQQGKEKYELSREQIIQLLADFAKQMRDKLK